MHWSLFITIKLSWPGAEQMCPTLAEHCIAEVWGECYHRSQHFNAKVESEGFCTEKFQLRQRESEVSPGEGKLWPEMCSVLDLDTPKDKTFPSLISESSGSTNVFFNIWTVRETLFPWWIFKALKRGWKVGPWTSKHQLCQSKPESLPNSISNLWT